MSSMFSWQNFISLCPASFSTPRPNLPVTPRISWLPTFAFQSLIMKRTSFLGVSSKRFVGFYRTVQLELLQLYWLGHRLGLLWYWMVFLGNEQMSFSRFETASKYCISDSFVDYDGCSISSKCYSQIYIIVQPSPPSIARTFFIFPDWNSTATKCNSPFPLPCLLATSFYLPSLSIWLLSLLHINGITRYLSFCDCLFQLITVS